MQRALPLLLALILAAGPVRAWELSPQAVEALRHGRSFLEVTPDPDGASGRIRAVVDLPVPPQTAWNVLVDCDLAPHMVSNLKSCRVLERDPLGRWDVREHISRAMLFIPRVRSVFRSDYNPPHSFSLHGIGGDLKVLEGAWVLTPLDGGRRTRVTYESRATLPFSVPGPLARIILRSQVAGALAALRRECVAEGQAPAA